jgi:hypothetical protein
MDKGSMGTPAVEAFTEPQRIPEGGWIYRPPLERRLLLAGILGIFGVGFMLLCLFAPIPRSIQEGNVGFVVESLVLCLLVSGILLWGAVASWRMCLLVAPQGLVYRSYWGLRWSFTWDEVASVETKVYDTRSGTVTKCGLALTGGCFIPLTDFDPDWEGGALGRTLRHYAPRAFAGRPVPSALPPTWDADRPWLVVHCADARYARRPYDPWS